MSQQQYTNAERVAMLSGLSVERLEELGGVAEDFTWPLADHPIEECNKYDDEGYRTFETTYWRCLTCDILAYNCESAHTNMLAYYDWLDGN